MIKITNTGFEGREEALGMLREFNYELRDVIDDIYEKLVDNDDKFPNINAAMHGEHGVRNGWDDEVNDACKDIAEQVLEAIYNGDPDFEYGGFGEIVDRLINEDESGIVSDLEYSMSEAGEQEQKEYEDEMADLNHYYNSTRL